MSGVVDVHVDVVSCRKSRGVEAGATERDTKTANVDWWRVGRMEEGNV